MAKQSCCTFRNEGGESTRANAARKGKAFTTEDFPLTGNVGLIQSLKFIGISKSYAYFLHLVATYDKDGNRIDEGKVAPFPWLPMPDSITRAPGRKKIFLAEEIRAWRDAITRRSRQIDDAKTNKPSALIKREEIQHEQQ
jgi:hypothetical protein